MQRHDIDGLRRPRVAVAVHHQRDVLEEAGEVLELLHGAHELLQVFQAAGGIGGTVLLPHVGIAGFIEHDLGELGVRHRILLRAPAIESDQQVAQRRARLRFHFVGGGTAQRRLRSAGMRFLRA